MASTERVLLIGMMGAGKTTVGKALAAELGWRYLDSDEQVQQHTGKTVPEIFAEQGEPAFRAEERRALEEAAGSDDHLVVSVAGGAVLDPHNRAVIKAAGFVVWLRATVETLAKRVGDGDGRPLLGDDPEEALRRLYPQRRPLYEELADLVVDVDDRPSRAVVECIVTAMP